MIPHTPTPWTPRENNPRNVASTLPDGTAHVVAVFASADDAAFAIHAANCHDVMLAALQDCAEALAFARDKLGMTGEGDGKDRKADADDTIGSLPALIAARAAISKAEGRT